MRKRAPRLSAVAAAAAAAEVTAAKAKAAAAEAEAEKAAAAAATADADAATAAAAANSSGYHRAASSPPRTATSKLVEAEAHARELRLAQLHAAEIEQRARFESAARLRFESAARLLSSIAPSSAATAAAAALAQAEMQARLSAQAAAVGADLVAERRQRETAEALASAEELARVAIEPGDTRRGRCSARGDLRPYALMHSALRK